MKIEDCLSFIGLVVAVVIMIAGCVVSEPNIQNPAVPAQLSCDTNYLAEVALWNSMSGFGYKVSKDHAASALASYRSCR